MTKRPFVVATRLDTGEPILVVNFDPDHEGPADPFMAALIEYELEHGHSNPTSYITTDLYVLCSRERNLDERMEAALRLAKGPFRYPIHSRRWQALGQRLLQELHTRAETHRTWRPEVELVLATQAALVEAGWAVTDWGGNPRDMFHSLRRLVSRIVTEDLLGDAYHREDRHTELPTEDDEDLQPVPEDGWVVDHAIGDVEAKNYLEFIVNGAGLSARDAELWLAVAWGRDAIADAAAALGMERGAADTALSRARRKIRDFLTTL